MAKRAGFDRDQVGAKDDVRCDVTHAAPQQCVRPVTEREATCG